MRISVIAFPLLMIGLLYACADTKSYLEGKWNVDTSISIAAYNDNECHITARKTGHEIIEFTGSGNVIVTFDGDTSITIPTYGIANDSLIVMGKRPIMDGLVNQRFSYFVHAEGDTCRLVSFTDSIVLSRAK